MNVKRFDASGVPHEDGSPRKGFRIRDANRPDGIFVKIDDYMRVAQKAARYRDMIRELMSMTYQPQDYRANTAERARVLLEHEGES